MNEEKIVTTYTKQDLDAEGIRSVNKFLVWVDIETAEVYITSKTRFVGSLQAIFENMIAAQDYLKPDFLKYGELRKVTVYADKTVEYDVRG